MSFKKLSVAEAKAAIDTNNAFVVDTRLPFDYFGGRIPGSLNLPAKSIGTRKQAVPQGRPILIMAENDEFGHEVAEFAGTLGFADVGHIEGGFDAWLEADYPTDTISEGLGPAPTPPQAPKPA